CTHYALHNVGRWISLAKDGGIVPKSNKMFKKQSLTALRRSSLHSMQLNVHNGSLAIFVQLFIFEFSTWLFRQSEAPVPQNGGLYF
ncbi:MAG: hypothetical protein IKM00_10120, partial [Clostridia bacterium]|nr:hypothetical protein [Clostridia bacterium]